MPVAYQCRRCKGSPLPQPWEGSCPHCGGFYRADVVTVAEGEVEGAQGPVARDGEPISASDLMTAFADDTLLDKRPTHLPGLDWLFDGGLPQFGVILLAAPEGCGKSTFLWMLLMTLAVLGLQTFFVSSEQSLKDLSRQFARCGAPRKRMLVDAQNDHGTILETLEEQQPQVFALDSIHDVENVKDERGVPLLSGGTHAVIRVLKDLRSMSERLPMLAFVVTHLNNDGTISGGSHIRYAADATLFLRRFDEQDDEDPRRVLQFQGKTRFGPLGRRALFVMEDSGLRDCGPLLKDPNPDNRPSPGT